MPNAFLHLLFTAGFAVLCCSRASGQQTVPELRQALKQAVSDSEKISLYLDLADEYEGSHYDSAYQAASKAVLLAKKNGSPLLLCKTNLRLGIVLQNNGRYKEANDYFFKGLKTAEALKHLFFEAQACNSIGNSFSYQKQHQEAIAYYNKALDLFAANGSWKETGVVLGNLGGEAYLLGYETKDFDPCYLYYKRSIDTCIKYKDENQLLDSYTNISIAYSDRGNYTEALAALEKANALAEKLHRQEDLVNLYYCFGRVYSQMNEKQKAESYFSKGIELSRKTDNKDYLSEFYLASSDNYKEQGNFQEAYAFMKMHKDLSDSLLNEESSRQLNELRTIYETEKKEEHIRQLKKEQAFEKKTRWFITATSLLALIILGLIINRLVYRKKKQKQLFEQEQQLLQTRQELTESELRSARKELLLQESELRQFMQNLIEKNSFIEQLQEKISASSPETFPQSNQGQIQELLQTTILTDEGWEKFKKLFSKVHQGFFVRLKDKYPDLTQGEIRLCALTRLKLNSKEIAQLLGISPASVNTTRYRLRKKWNLAEEDSFEELVLAV